MVHYRLFLLDDEGHPRRGLDLDCINDDEAIATAATYVDGCAVELWEKTRRVARLPAATPTMDRLGDLRPDGARCPITLELDWAELQVAEARKRVDRLTQLLDDEMRRGHPVAHSRELLTACQEQLREMIAHRDAVFADVKKGKPETESPELPKLQKSAPHD